MINIRISGLLREYRVPERRNTLLFTKDFRRELYK